METLIYGLMSLGIITFILWKVKKKNVNGDNLEKKKKKLGVIKLPFVTYIEGLDYLSEGQQCNLVVDDEKLTIVSDKTKTFNISLERIINAGILTKKEAEMKNKSAVGRGIVGGVLTGGVGLLLGGLSGVGQKVKQKSKYFLFINYKSKDSEDIKIITFGLMVQNERFVKQLTKRINTEINVDL